MASCEQCGKRIKDGTRFCPAKASKCRIIWWSNARKMGAKKGKMHFSSVSGSQKLRRVLACLFERSHTTIDLQNRTGLCSISTWVSMLRKNGYTVKCELIKGGTDKIYLYTLEKSYIGGEKNVIC